MFIRSLDLEGFRSHSKTSIRFARFTYLVGPAGSGKSSIADAIATAITGRNRHIDKRGSGLRDDIRVGAGAYKIGVVIQNGHKDDTIIHRTVSTSQHTLTYPECPGDVRRGQERLLGFLGLTDDLIATLLDTQNFSERSTDDQKAVLRKLLSRGTIEVPPEARAAGITDIPGIEVLETLIKQLKEDTIRGLNREIKALNEAMPPDPGGVPDIGEIREKKDRAAAALENAVAARSSILQKKTMLDQRLRTVRAELAGLSDGSDQAMVDEAKSKLERCRGAFEEASESIGKARTNLSQVEAQGKAAAGMGGMCGVVPLFKCPLTDPEKAAMVTELRQKHKQYSQEVKTLLAAVSGLEASYNEAQKYLDSVSSHAADGKRKAELSAEEKRLSAEIETNGAELSQSEARIPGLREALSPLEIELQAVQTAGGAKAQRKSMLDKVDEIRQKVEVHSAAAEALVSLREKLTADGQGGFVGAINGFLESVGMGTLQITSDPFGIRVDGVPLSHLSSGQKVIVDAAIRVAAASATGAGVIAIDDANKLGDDLARKMFTALYNSGIQVIVCKTTDTKPGDAWSKQLDGERVTAYWAQNPSVIGPSHLYCLDGGVK